MTLLQTLIASAQADEAKKAAFIKAAQTAAQTRGLATLRSILPDEIWTALNVDWHQTTYGSEGAAEATGTVEVSGETIRWNATLRHNALKIFCRDLNLYEETGRDEDSTTTVSRFLLSVSRSIATRREKERLERLRDIVRILGYRISHNDDPAKVVGLRDEAVALAPERFNEFMALYDDWMKRYDQFVADQAKHEQAKAEREAVTKAFVERKAEWYRQAQAVVDHNNAVTAKYQALADVPADLILLTYALAGDDGDGGLAVETKEVYCYQVNENNPAFWPVIAYGPEFAIQETYFMHPVSFRKVSVKPTDRVYPVSYSSDHCGQRLVIGPATPAGLVDQWKSELRTIDTASMPDYPKDFTSHNERSIADEEAMSLAEYTTDDLYF